MTVAAVFVPPNSGGEEAVGYVAGLGYKVWPVVGGDVIPAQAGAVYAPGQPDIEDRARIAGLTVIASPDQPIGD